MKQTDPYHSGRVRRNKPCPCGSGRKHKHCCGRVSRKRGPTTAPIDPLRRLARGIPVLGAESEELRALYDVSNAHRNRYRDALASLDSYCFFVGYPRSGHSLVGALLDAHPDVVIAHELDVLKFMDAGFDRSQIDYLLIENARLCAQAGRRWGSYSYRVSDQWQGQFRSIKVLGDKKGGNTSLRIGKSRAKLDALIEMFDGRVKFIHVVRNPFDVIATNYSKSSSSLRDTMEAVFFLARTNAFIRESLPSNNIIDLWHEDTVAEPRRSLARVCEFLGVDTDPQYLEACAGVVSRSASRSRDALDWAPGMIGAIERQSRQFDFLARYSFHS